MRKVREENCCLRGFIQRDEEVHKCKYLCNYDNSQKLIWGSRKPGAWLPTTASSKISLKAEWRTDLKKKNKKNVAHPKVFQANSKQKFIKISVKRLEKNA